MTIASDYPSITEGESVAATVENNVYQYGGYEITNGAAAYQWYRVEAGGAVKDAVAIEGATSSTYTLTSADKGYDVFVKVTNVRPAYAANAGTDGYVASNVATYDGDGGWTIK